MGLQRQWWSVLIAAVLVGLVGMTDVVAAGEQWTVLTDWIAPDQALVRPLVEASAAKYAQDKGITPRTCP